jgi:hypothetical protein
LQEKFPKVPQIGGFFPKVPQSATICNETQRFGGFWRILADFATIWRILQRNATIWQWIKSSTKFPKSADFSPKFPKAQRFATKRNEMFNPHRDRNLWSFLPESFTIGWTCQVVDLLPSVPLVIFLAVPFGWQAWIGFK